MRSQKSLLVVAVLSLSLTACDDGVAELTTSSSVVGSQTTTSVATPTTEPGSPTTLLGEPVSDYEVMSTENSVSGEILYILIPVGGYTDVDLENFVHGLIESDEEFAGLEIFDDPDALEAALKAESERTDADIQLLADHHLVSLIDRSVISFRGPFSHLGDQVIGS